jgi:hypothetical protein
MWTRSKRSPSARSQRHPVQKPWRGTQMPIAVSARTVITAFESDYVIDQMGRYVAVIRLMGSDVGVVEDEVVAGRLQVLQDYLERTPDPLQRISATYLQPLDPYLNYLHARFLANEKRAPRLAGLVKELAMYLETARERFQARLGAEYWVVTYAPGGLRLPRKQRIPSQTSTPPDIMTAATQQKTGVLAALRRSGSMAQARAERELNERCALLLGTLKRAGIEAERVTDLELAALFVSTWGDKFAPVSNKNPANEQEPIPIEVLEEQVRNPTGLLDVTRQWAHTRNGYVRSWYLRDFHGEITPEMISRLAQEPGVRVLQFWEQVPMAEARRVLRINRTIAASERHLRPQGDIPDYDWQAKAQDNDEVRAALAFRGDPVYRYHAIIQQWAESTDQLATRSQATALHMEDRMNLLVHPATFRQEEALVSALPLARCRVERPERNLDAKSLARLAYPGPRDPLQPKGVWMGMALPSRLMVTMDLFGLQNPVVELVGIMGSGKSMTQKFLLTQLIGQGYPGFVLDGAREYISTIEALGGTILRLGSVHGPGFNPVHFDPLDESEEGDPFVTGQALFLDWVEAALRRLSDIEKTVIGEAYLRALEKAGIKRSDRATWDTPRPILSQVHAALLEEPGDPDLGYDNPQIVARKLALALKPFALGVYAPLFNRADEVSLENQQLVCFDIYDVPDRLRLAYVHQLLAFVQRQTLRRYRYQGSVVVLDEGHLLLHDERSAQILEHLVRNGRKAGQIMLFTQHTHADSQRNHSAQLAHKTAGATLVFRINRQDVATLDDLHLTDLEKQIVVEQNEGECLLVSPAGHVRLKILIPPPWYSRFTTKPAEVLEQQQPQHAPEHEAAPEEETTVAPQPEPASGTSGPAPGETAPLPYTPSLSELMDNTDADLWHWEQTLVGVDQVAQEWLQQEEVGQNGSRHVDAVQTTEQITATLHLVWSRDATHLEANEGGDASSSWLGTGDHASIHS